MVAIRLATPRDRSRLFEIWKAAVDATHNFLSAADRDLFAGLVRDEYLPNAELWVAPDEHDDPVAFLGLSGAKIDALFVHPDAHGRGIGRAMIEHARSTAAPLSVDVNEQNEGAAAFYRKLGFRQIGRSELDDSGRPYPLLHMQE